MAGRAAEFKEKITNDHRFLRKYYSWLIVGLMVLLLLLMAAVGLVLYQVKTRPLPQFDAHTQSGEVLQLTPFESPNLLPETLIRFASKGAVAAYTFRFSNYKQQLQLARPYFTEAGWQDYLVGVNSLIATIVQNKINVNSMVADTPVISNQGPLPGRGMTWRIQIPFLVTYTSENTNVKRNFMVLITLVTVPTIVNPQGVGIDQFVMVGYGGQ